MKFLTISLLAIATLFNIPAHAACPVGPMTVVLTTQAEVDAFPTTYAGCTNWPSNVKLRIIGMGITNLDGLIQLTSIGGNLDIKNCSALTDITGLANLTSAGELDIERCTSLASLAGLSLSTLGDLEISGCDALTDISDLSTLTALGGELYIKENDALASLNGLHNITSIGDSLVLDGNDLLLDLDGLSSLTSIGSDLTIDNNDALNDMTGLNALTSIGDDVRIIDNISIISLDGLGNVTSIGGGLDVKENILLADCLGSCEMINAILPPENYYFSGNLSVQCNDEVTLEADCLIFLPVELTDFRAAEDKKTQNVVLSWTTESELNNKHFEVQRTLDGRAFETLGIVAGNGTSTKVNYYDFIDIRPAAIAYYRLKQVDYNGNIAYSDLVQVNMTEYEVAHVEAFPTIAENEITIRFTGFKAQKGTYSVFNFQGRLVKTNEVDLSSKMAYTSLDVSAFEKGIYTLVITNDSKQISTNFIVVK